MVKRKTTVIEEEEDTTDEWGPAEGQQTTPDTQGPDGEQIITSHPLSEQEVEEEEAAKRAKIPLGHPKILAAYERAEMEYKPTSEDIREYRWRLRAYNDIRKTIDQIYRIKLGNSEWLLYNETNIARDKMGNKVTHPKLVGRYPYPEFNYRYDEESGGKIGTEKVGDKVMYEIPYSVANFEKILAKDTEGTQPNLVLQNGTQKFAGYTIHEFMTRSFEDLLIKGRTGSLPQGSNKEDNNPSESGGKAIVKEVKKGLVKIEGEGEASKTANDFIVGSKKNTNDGPQ